MVLMQVMVILGYRPMVVSMDHGLREEARSEVELVEREASRLGLEFQAMSLAVEAGPNLAERAREARYAALEALDVKWIALGHHRDDQVETVIDRLMRGGGSRGLSGIPSSRGRFVRPLMQESRESIRDWALQRRIPFVEDPSNRGGTRGKIRHEILPLMREIRSGTAAAIARTADHLREDEDWLSEQAELLIGPEGIALPEGAPQPPRPLLRRAILELVRRARGDASGLGASQVSQILELKRPGSWLDIGGGFRAVRDPFCIRVVPDTPPATELVTGGWGVWQIEASSRVRVRALLEGEVGEGTALRERLRAAGVGPALRRLYPVIEVQGRRWLPGVWLEPSEHEHGVRVLCGCPARASIPPGGPFTSEL